MSTLKTDSKSQTSCLPLACRNALTHAFKETLALAGFMVGPLYRLQQVMPMGGRH